ncbi:uncharacterized protein LOC144577436 [Callithrix jacchus]
MEAASPKRAERSAPATQPHGRGAPPGGLVRDPTRRSLGRCRFPVSGRGLPWARCLLHRRNPGSPEERSGEHSPNGDIDSRKVSWLSFMIFIKDLRPTEADI